MTDVLAPIVWDAGLTDRFYGSRKNLVPGDSRLDHVEGHILTLHNGVVKTRQLL